MTRAALPLLIGQGLVLTLALGLAWGLNGTTQPESGAADPAPAVSPEDQTCLANSPIFQAPITVVATHDVVDHQDRPVAWDELRGRPLVIGFMFTACPMAHMCPRFTHQMQRLHEMADHHPVQPHFISISIDPANDRPDVLREYAQLHDIDLANWSFWTSRDGSTAPIQRIADALGVVMKPGHDGDIAHNLRLYVTDAELTIQAGWRTADWQPGHVLDALIELDAAGHD